jgi:ubiquinone/menaquinone biosynthesis C-methylase UbiE
MNAPSSSAAVLPLPAHAGKFRDLRTEALADLIRASGRRPIRRLLVVGCGSGKEAAVLADVLGADTTGVDIVVNFDPAASMAVRLLYGDATRLEFVDGSFDCVYSYHALEHIPQHAQALQEMRRVLANDGLLCIGTPNRSRLFAYFGSRASLREKLRWNMIDWKARLRGRFRNEYGAHAGFTSGELRQELQNVFGNAEEITLPYYLRVYRNHVRLCRFLSSSGLGQMLFPCVYFLGRKRSVA